MGRERKARVRAATITSGLQPDQLFPESPAWTHVCTCGQLRDSPGTFRAKGLEAEFPLQWLKDSVGEDAQQSAEGVFHNPFWLLAKTILRMEVVFLCYSGVHLSHGCAKPLTGPCPA